MKKQPSAILRQSQRITQHFLDILFPPHCVTCKKSGSVLCPSCFAQIHPLSSPLCQGCSTPLATYARSGLCERCQRTPSGLSGLRAVGTYHEPLRGCIVALKYDGNTRLAEPLGHLLAQTYLSSGFRVDVFVAVPLHQERYQQRGYNHSQLLAQSCTAQLGIPLADNLLIRHRATPAQVGLSADERGQNVAGAFLCPPAFTTGALLGRSIGIIDDVCTSGATLRACAEPLFAAGALAVWGLVLARPDW